MSRVILNSDRELHVDTVFALFVAVVFPLLLPFYVVLTGNLYIGIAGFAVATLISQGNDWRNLLQAVPRASLFSPWWSFVPFVYYWKRDATGFANFKLFHFNGAMYGLALVILAFII